MDLSPWRKESGGETLSLDGVLWLDMMQPEMSVGSYVLQITVLRKSETAVQGERAKPEARSLAEPGRQTRA